MAKKLKVYGWSGFRSEAPGYHHQTREIVAATSKAEVARIVGDKSPRKLVNLSETRNPKEVAVAMSRPGVVFWRGLNDYGGEFVAVEGDAAV